MHHKHGTEDPLLLKALPMAARPSPDSSSLADKFASRIEWMREKGIGISVVQTKIQRPESKPLPGTVIYFRPA